MRDPDEDGGSSSQAMALGYDRGADAAPRVLAQGQGEVAARILERAAQHGIPVEKDPDLLQCLAPLQVGEEVPVEAFQAVAQILGSCTSKTGARETTGAVTSSPTALSGLPVSTLSDSAAGSWTIHQRDFTSEAGERRGLASSFGAEQLDLEAVAHPVA